MASNSETYHSVMDILNNPSANKSTDFEAQQESLMEGFFNFSPERVLRQLIDLSSSDNITAMDFHDEIRTLISARFRANKCVFDDIKDEAWYADLEYLERKYTIDKPSSDSEEAISFTRLCVLFPHYALLHTEHTVIQRPELWLSNVFFFQPEFGGLIPANPLKIDFRVKHAIVTVHLVCLRKRNPLVAGKTNEILLKRRIETSLLSDERRIHYLTVMGVITSAGKLTWETQAAHRYIKKYITPNPDEL